LVAFGGQGHGLPGGSPFPEMVLRVVHQGRLFTFAYYCWAVGILMILLAK